MYPLDEYSNMDDRPPIVDVDGQIAQGHNITIPRGQIRRNLSCFFFFFFALKGDTCHHGIGGNVLNDDVEIEFNQRHTQ